MAIPTIGGSKVHKITLEKLKEARKRIKQKDKGTDEEYYRNLLTDEVYYRNLLEEFLKGSRYYKIYKAIR